MVEKIKIGEEERKVWITTGKAGGVVNLAKISAEEKTQAIKAIKNRLEQEGKKLQRAYYNPKTGKLEVLFLSD